MDYNATDSGKIYIPEVKSASYVMWRDHMHKAQPFKVGYSYFYYNEEKKLVKGFRKV